MFTMFFVRNARPLAVLLGGTASPSRATPVVCSLLRRPPARASAREVVQKHH